MLTIAARNNLEWAVVWLTSSPKAAITAQSLLSAWLSANEILQQFEHFAAHGQSLPSQSGLCLRESVGASRGLTHGPSLGDSTSAGAENSQAPFQFASKSLLNDEFTQSCCG